MQRSFWDAYSLTYDAIRFSIPYARHLERIVAEMQPATGTRVLDLGCATGNLESAIARAAPAAHVVGVDSSEGMLRRAARKCAEWPDVSFVSADVSVALPFSDSSFDAVVVNNLLYTIEDKGALVAEIVRVLAPGGTLVLSDPKPGARVSEVVRDHFRELRRLPFHRRLAGYAQTLVTLPMAGVAPMLMSLAVIGRRVERGEYRFSSAEELRELLTAFPAVALHSVYADQSWMAVAVKPAASRTA